MHVADGEVFVEAHGYSEAAGKENRRISPQQSGQTAG